MDYLSNFRNLQFKLIQKYAAPSPHRIKELYMFEYILRTKLTNYKLCVFVYDEENWKKKNHNKENVRNLFLRCKKKWSPSPQTNDEFYDRAAKKVLLAR